MTRILDMNETVRRTPGMFYRSLFYLTIMAFFVVTIVVIATPALSNEKTSNAIFGSFDSTGAAIILIGLPYLCLQYLEHHHRHYSM